MLRISATSASCRNRGAVTRRSLASLTRPPMSAVHSASPGSRRTAPARGTISDIVHGGRRGGPMTEAVSSPATRLVVPRWLDARVAVGLLLVLVSVAAGARVVSSAGHLAPVYAAAHELVPGEQLTRDDVAVVQVRLGGGGSRYLAASAAAPVGYVVNRVVGAHELLPAAALSPATALADRRMVTVPVQPGHLPADLGRGDLVDVYVTPKVASGKDVPMPVLVLSKVAVTGREGGSRGFGGESALAVLLSVEDGDVPALIHAIESGLIDLVRVPSSAAGAPTR